MRAHQLITRSYTLIMNSLLRQESWRRNAPDSFERALTLTDFRQDHDIAGRYRPNMPPQRRPTP